MNKKIIKTIVFITSATLCALLFSRIIKLNIKPELKETNISIEHINEGYIGETSILDILNNKDDEIFLEEIEEVNIKETEEVINEEINIEKDNDIKKTNNDINPVSNNKVVEEKKSNNIIENLSEKSNDDKISNEDLTFLMSLLAIGDNISNNYNEILSYALSGDFEKGKDSINLLKNDFDSLSKLSTNNKQLNKIKKNYSEGVKYFIEGFTEHFNYKKSANDTLIKADTYIYNAQEYLKKFLKEYKL